MTTFFNTTTVGQDIEFKRILNDAGWTSKDIDKVIKNPSIASDMLVAVRGVATTQRPRVSSRFAQYKQHLNSLAEQKKLLVAFNAQAGDLAVSQSWIEGLSTTGRHTQSLESLEVFVVWCGTLEKTFRYAQALMKFSQGKIWDSGFKTDEKSMRLHARAFAYSEAGVYRARVNLVDNWEPEKSRSVEDVYNLAAAKPDYILTSVEGIFGYALQKRQLIRQQDGTNLPYTDCPGIQQGDGFARVVVFHWFGINDGVRFLSYDAGFSDAFYSRPSLLGVPRKVA
jgi:hypothetical protein